MFPVGCEVDVRQHGLVILAEILFEDVTWIHMVCMHIYCILMYICSMQIGYATLL